MLTQLGKFTDIFSLEVILPYLVLPALLILVAWWFWYGKIWKIFEEAQVPTNEQEAKWSDLSQFQELPQNEKSAAEDSLQLLKCLRSCSEEK